MRKSMMGLIRKGKAKVHGSGFVVTWDVDSKDRSATYRMWSFLFGRKLKVDGREYTYEGFVWKDGVRCLGQSVVFVLPHRLPEILDVLGSCRIDHEVACGVFT